MLLFLLKGTLCFISPGELATLHAVCDWCHDATEVRDEASVGGKAVKAPHVRDCPRLRPSPHPLQPHQLLVQQQIPHILEIDSVSQKGALSSSIELFPT